MKRRGVIAMLLAPLHGYSQKSSGIITTAAPATTLSIYFPGAKPDEIALSVHYGKRKVELTVKEVMDALEGK